jgi:hypothetical protein
MKNRDLKFSKKIKHFQNNNNMYREKDHLKIMKSIHLMMMIKMNYLKIVQIEVKAHTMMVMKNQKDADFKKATRNLL